MAWLGERFPARVAVLSRYVELILTANREQNLISRSTEAAIWARHIVDSAQLVGFAPKTASWLDIGSGAGLPGIVIAILTGSPILLVEPRRKRADFLANMTGALGLSNAMVDQRNVERLSPQSFDAITARAYAPLPDIFESAGRLSQPSTVWILPKGRTAQAELAAARDSWQGVFHVEHSLTDDDARIVVATGIQQR